MYKTFSRPGLLPYMAYTGVEGDPPTRDNFSPYKQALKHCGFFLAVGRYGGNTNHSWKDLLLLLLEPLDTAHVQ